MNLYPPLPLLVIVPIIKEGKKEKHLLFAWNLFSLLFLATPIEKTDVGSMLRLASSAIRYIHFFQNNNSLVPSIIFTTWRPYNQIRKERITRVICVWCLSLMVSSGSNRDLLCRVELVGVSGDGRERWKTISIEKSFSFRCFFGLAEYFRVMVFTPFSSITPSLHNHTVRTYISTHLSYCCIFSRIY